MLVLSCNFSFSPWHLPSNYSSMSWCSFLQLKKRLTSFKHANFHLGWQHNLTPPVATQLLDPVESREWGEGEGQDGPSQPQASKICLSIAEVPRVTDIWLNLCCSVARQTFQHISPSQSLTPWQQFLLPHRCSSNLQAFKLERHQKSFSIQEHSITFISVVV